jgi:hypothetical protein
MIEGYEPELLSGYSPVAAPMTCTPKRLTIEQAIAAAQFALEQNPANQSNLVDLWPAYRLHATPDRLAIVNGNKWGPGPQVFPVYFFDPRASAIPQTMAALNEWSPHCNKSFQRSMDPTSICRISFGPGGLYSYVGTDNGGIPHSQQTMNLQGYTANTPWTEFQRGASHEAGHFLGCIHEHQLRDIVVRLNRQAVIRWGARTQGWSRQESIRQMLTPYEESQLLVVPGDWPADEASIMAYHFDAELTLDGKPILGGSRINARDAAYIALAYPKAVEPPPPVEPPPSVGTFTCRIEEIGTGEMWRGTLQPIKTQPE